MLVAENVLRTQAILGCALVVVGWLSGGRKKKMAISTLCPNCNAQLCFDVAYQRVSCERCHCVAWIAIEWEKVKDTLDGEQLIIEQVLEMMNEEGVEKIRSRAGEWIGRDDIRASIDTALEAMTIIEGVRGLDKPGANRYELHPYCPDEDGDCIYGHPVCPNKALRTAQEDRDDA